MARTYGTNDIPYDIISVGSGGTVGVSTAFESTAGLVGGMDTSNGTATPGEVVALSSGPTAESQFGEGSELARGTKKALANGVSTVYAVPVAETETTDTVSDGEVLTEAPVMDPNVQPEHTLDGYDNGGGASADVAIDYNSPPTHDANEGDITVNPITGEVKTDSANTFDITYTYGDYQNAIDAAVVETPRFIAALTENVSVANHLEGRLSEKAQDFEFMHGIVGASPGVEAANYTDSFDSSRLSVVAASRGFEDVARTEEVRTVSGVAGLQAAKELGDSTTYESVDGYAVLRDTYTNSQLGDLIDKGVLPLKSSGRIFVVKDMTTSQNTKFERIYVDEIADEATERSHQINQQFIGDANTDTNRFLLYESHRSAFEGMEENRPPLLDDFVVEVSEAPNDPNEVRVNIGLDVVDMMDYINVSILVGDIVRQDERA